MNSFTGTQPIKRKSLKTKGRFIVLDGPDGAGKSTQAKLLSEKLRGHGIDVILLREPGGTPLGEAVRAILLEHRKDDLSTLTEAFLFQAARAQLVEKVIAPALQKGTWVLCDRFTLSTLVYQSYAGGVDRKVVETLSQIATAGVKPDAYIVLTVPAHVGVERRGERPADRMESKGKTFANRVADGYRKAVRFANYTILDGVGTPEEISARIWKRVEKYLK